MPQNESPYIKAKPKIQNIAAAMIKSEIFFAATSILFLLRIFPVSRHKNPGCIKKTNIETATTNHIL